MDKDTIKTLVKERVSYDPISGELTWKERDKSLHCYEWFNENKAGKSCCSINISKADGYKSKRFIIEYKGEKIRVVSARAAWLLMTGDWPKHTIDHINKDSLDNRWVNLRDVTQAENNKNKGSYSSNKTGYKGVSLHNGRYWARVSYKGETYRLGHYETPEEAHNVCEQKRKALSNLHECKMRENSLDESFNICH